MLISLWALAAFMALYGAAFAIMENDMRRLLGYHIISQVGFMVAGVGVGTAMALNGAAAHAFSHILYKSLLFMCAGAIIYATGIRKKSINSVVWLRKCRLWQYASLLLLSPFPAYRSSMVLLVKLLPFCSKDLQLAMIGYILYWSWLVSVLSCPLL